MGDSQSTDIELYKFDSNEWLALHVETEVVGVGFDRKTALESLDETLSGYCGYDEVLPEDELY